jgi:hypothetical protein
MIVRFVDIGGIFDIFLFKLFSKPLSVICGIENWVQ